MIDRNELIRLLDRLSASDLPYLLRELEAIPARRKDENLEVLADLLVGGASFDVVLKYVDAEGAAVMCESIGATCGRLKGENLATLRRWFAGATARGPADVEREEEDSDADSEDDDELWDADPHEPAFVDSSETESDDSRERANRGTPRPLTDLSQGSIPAIYPYQSEAVQSVLAGAHHTPPVSGIVHIPTGGGKTRVALEVISRTLKLDPRHRFVWATAGLELIRQSMERFDQQAPDFPEDLRIAWFSGRTAEIREEVQVLFLTRTHLTQELRRACSRAQHPWRTWLEARRPVTLIYDECHQLGAAKLQQALRRFYDKVAAPPTDRPRPWRMIGLSATPLPTSEDARRLLQTRVFPRRPEVKSPCRSRGGSMRTTRSTISGSSATACSAP